MIYPEYKINITQTRNIFAFFVTIIIIDEFFQIIIYLSILIRHTLNIPILSSYSP